MREVVDVRFRASLLQPATWLGLSGASLLFLAMGVAALVRAGAARSEHFGGTVLIGVLAATFGLFLLRDVALRVADWRSCRAQIVTVTLLQAQRVRHGNILLQLDEGLAGYATVPAHWCPARLPQRAELWRAARTRRPLVLVLHDEGRVCSVLEGPRAP
jgi:hypothetical protein